MAVDYLGLLLGGAKWYYDKKKSKEEESFIEKDYIQSIEEAIHKENIARQRVKEKGDVANLGEYTANLRGATQAAQESLGNVERAKLRDLERQSGRERSNVIASHFGEGGVRDKRMDDRLDARNLNMLKSMQVGRVGGTEAKPFYEESMAYTPPDEDGTTKEGYTKYSDALRDQFTGAGIPGSPSTWARVGSHRMGVLGLDVGKRARDMAAISHAVQDSAAENQIGMQKLARADAKEKSMADAFGEDVTMAGTDIERERRKREDMVAQRKADISAGYNTGTAIMEPIDTTGLGKAARKSSMVDTAKSIYDIFA